MTWAGAFAEVFSDAIIGIVLLGIVFCFSDGTATVCDYLAKRDARVRREVSGEDGTK